MCVSTSRLESTLIRVTLSPVQCSPLNVPAAGWSTCWIIPFWVSASVRNGKCVIPGSLSRSRSACTSTCLFTCAALQSAPIRLMALVRRLGSLSLSLSPTSRLSFTIWRLVGVALVAVSERMNHHNDDYNDDQQPAHTALRERESSVPVSDNALMQCRLMSHSYWAPWQRQ